MSGISKVSPKVSKLGARLIKTEDEYRLAIEEVDGLMSKLPKPGTARGDRLELLTLLISTYEDYHFPIPEADPIEVLNFAMEDMGHSQADLAKLLGSRPRASEIVNRKRPLTLEMIRIISEAWQLPLAVLAAPYALAGDSTGGQPAAA